MDARLVLSKILVARPFTAIQFIAMLNQKIPKIQESLPPGQPLPVILSDPMALFYDSALPEADARRIFRDFLKTVAGLTAPVLALFAPRVPPNTRKGFAKQLLRYVMSVEYVKEPEGSHG